jgi:DNA replication and repair protein RecF
MELIGGLAQQARVVGEVEAADGASTIEIEIETRDDRTRRTIKVNQKPRRAVDLPGAFRVSLFWPEDLSLVKAGPEQRRRFLNELLVQVEPGYARTLARYTRALEQRNHLLKRIARHEEGPASLAAWDVQVAELGTALTAARAEAVQELEPLSQHSHTSIAGNEQLQLTYLRSEGDLARLLAENLAEDVRRGVTTVGPHRDDVLVLLNGRDARSFASQGQQRTAVVSLKLAEAALIEARTGEAPVLLLDDVLSELDLERRDALFQQLSGQSQVIITSVDATPFPERLLDAAHVRCISAGRIQPCG